MKNAKNIKNILSIMIVFGAILVTEVWANATTYTYTLEAGKKHGFVAYKSTNTDSFGYKLNDVWPLDDSDEDNYTRIKLSLKDGDGVTLLSERVITEGTSVVTLAYEGEKDRDKGDSLIYYLRGNNPELGAYANLYTNWY